MLLGVNIDHVATLRQARRSEVPDPVLAALLCESSGADSIVVHLREDRRHIQDADVCLLRKVIKTRLNLEMSSAPEIVQIACQIKPDQATLVPERRQELTTEGGLDVAAGATRIRRTVALLQKGGIEVSLFIDPDKRQIDASCKTGARIIELHTGGYAEAKNKQSQERLLRAIEGATRYARSKKLVVNAGHGLDYNNVTPIARIKGIEELNIGYAIVCRSLVVGLGQAVQQMKALIG